MRLLLLGIALLFSSIIIGQDFQGKAYYFSKTKMGIDFSRRQIPEDQKKEIMERLKSASEKTFILNFDKSTSTYKEEARLQNNRASSGRFAMMRAGLASTIYYKDIKNKIYNDQRDFYGKNFLIIDSLQNFEWKLINETKKIGNYTCFKAITYKKVGEQLDFRSIRRKARQLRDSRQKDRERKEGPRQPKPDQSPKTIEVIAWYTPEIPINQGPGAYWGLPGLILEIQEGNTSLLCNKIILNIKEVDRIKAPSNGKKVTQKEFDEIAKKKINQMIQQFSTQRRDGPSGRGGGRKN